MLTPILQDTIEYLILNIIMLLDKIHHLTRLSFIRVNPWIIPISTHIGYGMFMKNKDLKPHIQMESVEVKMVFMIILQEQSQVNIQKAFKEFLHNIKCHNLFGV